MSYKNLNYSITIFYILLLCSCNTPLSKEQKNMNYSYKIEQLNFSNEKDSIHCFGSKYVETNIKLKNSLLLTKAAGILNIQHEDSILNINIYNECFFFLHQIDF